MPSTGVGESAALDLIAGLLEENGIDLSHPHAAAHLQPPVLQVAVDADALASASNASMDTYDSGPATLAIEQWVVKALAGLAGFGPEADGVLTPGGSISNLLAVLIARDSAAARARTARRSRPASPSRSARRRPPRSRSWRSGGRRRPRGTPP